MNEKEAQKACPESESFLKPCSKCGKDLVAISCQWGTPKLFWYRCMSCDFESLRCLTRIDADNEWNEFHRPHRPKPMLNDLVKELRGTPEYEMEGIRLAAAEVQSTLSSLFEQIGTAEVRILQRETDRNLDKETESE